MDVAIVRKEFPALLKCPDYVFGDAPTGTQCHYTVSEAMHKYLGMISHKMSIITSIRIKNFIKILIFITQKISTGFDFGSDLEQN